MMMVLLHMRIFFFKKTYVFFIGVPPQDSTEKSHLLPVKLEK